MKTTVALVFSFLLVGTTLLAQEDVAIKSLLSKELKDVPDKELSMITVEYSPGAQDPVHTHNAHTMVYVLEGSIVMQVKGGAPVTLKPGETFYEGPQDVHIVGAGNSAPAWKPWPRTPQRSARSAAWD